jgi:hypothetical protein
VLAAQTSSSSEMAKASSTSVPRYRTIFSIFECPRSSWTGYRGKFPGQGGPPRACRTDRAVWVGDG